MASFLNTSAITFCLERLITKARERLVIVSPYLKFNDRIRELLEDKNRLKLDIRIVYGKTELQPDEIDWLGTLEFVRCSFCKNLHAKCYMSESNAIITSMNMYEFSQVNNNEMGVLFKRSEDRELFDETHAEVQRIIRISDEVQLRADRVETRDGPPSANTLPQQVVEMISTSRLAKQRGVSSKRLFQKLVEMGLLVRDGEGWALTESGLARGGVVQQSSRFGEYVTWPEDLDLSP